MTTQAQIDPDPNLLPAEESQLEIISVDVTGLTLADGSFAVDICSLSVPATLHIFHVYETPVEIAIEICTNENVFTIDPPLGLSNITVDINPFTGAYCLAGTFTLDPATFSVEIPIVFQRVGSIQSILRDLITIRVLDPNFSVSNPVYERSFNISPDEPFLDMRNIPFTKISDLLNNGLVDNPIKTTHILVGTELEIDVPHAFAAFPLPVVPEFEIRLMPGARIVVPASGPLSPFISPELTIQQATVGGCPNLGLGEGIVVEALPPNQSPGLTPVNIVLNDVKFEHNRRALSMKAGSGMDLIDCNFVDNYIGLHLDMTGGSAQDNRIRIRNYTNNQFSTGTSGLIAAYPGMPEQLETRGFCGIYAKNYNALNIWGGTTFENLANGIVLENCTGNIGNMTFSDINPSAGAAQYPFRGRAIHMVSRNNTHFFNVNELWTNMTMTDCQTGVFASGMAGNVENVAMNNVGVGIDWQKSATRDIFFDQNTIQARTIGIRSSLNEPLAPNSRMDRNTIKITTPTSAVSPNAAIIATEMNGGFAGGWRIANNTITLANGGLGIRYLGGVGSSILNNAINNAINTLDYTGIRSENLLFSSIAGNNITQSAPVAGLGYSQGLRSSSGVFNTFTCNCFDNTNAGMQFYDMAEFTNRVRGNNFNNHVTGLRVGDPNWTSAYIGEQRHRGNTWDLGVATGTNGFFGAVNYNQNGLILSRFWVDQVENPDFSPVVDPGAGWFFEQANSAPSFVCASACVPPAGLAGEGEDDLITALDEVVRANNFTLLPDLRWKGEYRLYQRLLRRPAMIAAHPQFEAWMQGKENTDLGQLAIVGNTIRQLLTPNTSILATTDALLADLGQKNDQLNALDQQPNVSTADYQSAVTAYATALEAAQQFGKARISSLKQAAPAVLAQNNAIATASAPANNQKTTNALYLGYILNDSLSAAELNTLDGIAQQCPTDGGDAVYEARALAGALLQKNYTDAACNTGNRENPAEAMRPEVNTIRVFPNPSTGFIRWASDGPARVHQVQVMDYLGRSVVSKIVNEPFMDLSGVKSGIYQLQFTDVNGNAIGTSRLVLLD